MPRRPSEAKQRHPPPRRSSRHSVAPGAPPRAARENRRGRSGEKNPKWKCSNSFWNPYSKHGSKERPVSPPAAGTLFASSSYKVRRVFKRRSCQNLSVTLESISDARCIYYSAYSTSILHALYNNYHVYNIQHFTICITGWMNGKFSVNITDTSKCQYEI